MLIPKMGIVITEETLFQYSLVCLLLSAPLSFLSLQFLSAPYGKHRRPGWGPLLYPPLAWFLMESPTLSLSLLLFPLGRNRFHPKSLSLFSPFLFHYFHRVFLYPLRLHLLNRRRNTAFPNTTYRKTSDRKTQYSETVDQVIDGRKTDDPKNSCVEIDDQSIDDRETACRNIADSKTQYSETIDRAIDDRKTAFQNTIHRKTTNRKTADPKTSFSETSDQFIDDRKTASLETADRKTSYGETIDRVIDDRKTASGFPASIAAMAFAYNIWNTYLQARWVSHYADFEADGWFWWRFCLGLVVFVTGMAINVWSDLVLLGLKGKGGEYNVPRGGLFEFVSCPNYFGEVVEWLGWAVMTWSWVGIGFFLFTCSNLVPRAHSHHKWYLDKFGEDYPKKRKAVIPFLY